MNSSDRDYSQEYAGLFKVAGTSLHLWLDAARELKASADVLYEAAMARGELDGRFIATCALTSGYALEVALKAVKIKRHPELVSEEGLEKKALKTHNLVRLARDLELDLSEQEQELLKGLTTFVVWAGHYPIPLVPDPRKWQAAYWDQAGYEAINDLFDRLVKMVEE
ncbi:MAG: hypothetical protein M3220_07760 [Chloroflexota bacterium]|nr:hypothetical protein [Chloroflexota bacterium]